MTDEITESQPELTWNKSLEEYFCNTSEKCMGYAWLHKRCEEMYSYRTVFLDLPTIVIGAVNGFVSVGSDKLFGNDQYASMYIGAVGLFVSLLSTISSYYSWGRKAEAHKIAGNAYSKLYRFIAVEMNTKPRDERMDPKKFLDHVRSTYDQLSESSPLIPPTIISDFNHKFAKLKDFSLPEETSGLHAVYAYPSLAGHDTGSGPNTPDKNLKRHTSFVVPSPASIPRSTTSIANTIDINHIDIKIRDEALD